MTQHAIEYLACYPMGDNVGATVTFWDGRPIGYVTRVTSRPAVFFGRRSCYGSRYYYLRVRLHDGREYAVRGFGHGMLATGRRVKEERA